MRMPPAIPLGEFCEIVSGSTPKTGVAEYWDGDIQWATPKDLSSLRGKFIDETLRKITDTGLRSCAAFILPEGSVLLSSRAPIGHVAINTRPMATNQGFKSLIPAAESADSSYLFHWLKANRDYLESLGNGATFKELSKSVVEKIKVPLPPLAEQRRIAEVLDQADALQCKRREAVALLDDLTQSIFLDMFDDPIPRVNLGEYLTFVTSGGRGWAKYYSERGVRFIRSLDVRMNEVDDGNVVYVTPPKNAEAKRTEVRSGDVLLTITGSLIGRVAAASSANHGSYVSQHVAILRANPDRLVPEFLAFFLSLPSGGQTQIDRMQYGQTKPGLNFEQIRNFQIPLPDIESQHEFVRRFAAVKSIRAGHHMQMTELDALFASVQQRAFRGELWNNRDI